MSSLDYGIGHLSHSQSSRPVRDPPEGSNAISPPQVFYSDTRDNKLVSVAPWLIPHDYKKDKGGEDTYFVSEDGLVIGVFDGVGGWADSGVNPREYSYRLMEECKLFTENNPNNRSPTAILQAGWNAAESVVGSSTACVVSFLPLPNEEEKPTKANPLPHTAFQMRVANLGDSGLLVVNNESGDIVFQTEEQHHYFNCPFQLGTSTDTPDDASKSMHLLHSGHTVVVGTDGMLDNLSTQQIADVILNLKHDTTQKVARTIATEAYKISLDSRAITPFTKKAFQNGIVEGVVGGKPDDITVVVFRFASDVLNLNFSAKL